MYEGVIAIACDMNADFESAFRRICPHLRNVLDYFQIIKNFNDMMVNEIRRDMMKRFEEEDNLQALKKLKHSKYILYTKVASFKKKVGSALRKESELFGAESQQREDGYEMRALDLKLENGLFFDVEIFRDFLDGVYRQWEVVEQMSNYCKQTRNSLFVVC